MGKKADIKLVKLKHRIDTLKTETEANMALLQVSMERAKSENDVAIERLRSDIANQSLDREKQRSEFIKFAVWLAAISILVISALVTGASALIANLMGTG